ncbi:putative acyl carrier protein [Aequoribacter fuscus]|uniref:Putative acyl carrier protein n=1 Tax=Aequoribacter fuscus TaxID=2518989 RepID=F3L3Q5_9GAMM|nr:acyl carrier protein [Aequoribacter fuscus]EGG29028.1 putative acyl carrier protein [Aequoribacter fuscus]QHJ88882.1 acyl carrier protein [Aequoribacter fuscus]
MSTFESSLKKCFIETLNIEESLVVDSLQYASIPQWDSVAHMSLIVSLEDEFDIMIDTDDVIEMSTFAKAKEIVQKYLD